MVINRVSLPKNRYALSEWLPTTSLPEILHTSLTHFHHNKLYEALVILTQHQRRIEDDLFIKTREKENGLRLMLYDITSTYFEGEQGELAAYGYSRDKQSGKKQLIIGLVTAPSGRPVTVEVLTGNTADKTTLLAKIEELRQRFNLTEVIYVFDRGMKDKQKLSVLRSNHVTYITALTRTEVETLAKAGVRKLGLFDEELAEYQQGERRYVICRSDQWERNRVRRENLLTKTEGELQKLKERVTQGKLKDPVKIARRLERSLSKWNMKKYFTVSIGKGLFHYQRKQEVIKTAEELDGVYVLETTDTQLTKEGIQESYKNLAKVEADFRVIKSILEVRPVHHRKKDTVKGHVFICFLALYLRRELELALKPLFDKQPALTFSHVLSQLREIRQCKLEAQGHQTVILNQLNKLQQEILSSLHMRVLPINLP